MSNAFRFRVMVPAFVGAAVMAYLLAQVSETVGVWAFWPLFLATWVGLARGAQ